MKNWIDKLPERYRNKLKAMPNGCVEWVGSRQPFGYGRACVKGRKVRAAHRVVYEIVIGPIGDGLQLDHLCKNPPCCRPDHLDPVTAKVNTHRSNAFSAVNLRKTCCPKGHPYSAENTYVYPSGGRGCRTCRRDRTRKWQERNREQSREANRASYRKHREDRLRRMREYRDQRREAR